MKIVYCLQSLSPGSATSKITVNKANWLATTQGYKVAIMLADQRGKEIPYGVANGVTVFDLKIEQLASWSYRIPVLGFFLKQRSLRRKYQKVINVIQPDIIVNLSVPDVFGEILPDLKHSAILIYESHGSQEGIRNRSARKLKKGLKQLFFEQRRRKQIEKFDHRVVLTDADKAHRIKRNKSLLPISVIPNAVLEYELKPNYQLTSKKVITAGRLVTDKNIKDQILIWKDIVKKHPDWSLHVFGEGPEKENLERLIQENGLAKYIFLEGKTLTLEKEYQKSSFFLLTSLSEGFGMVIVEAMQMGLPVVCYDCPSGPRSIISEGEDGFLIPMADREQLKERVEWLITHPEERLKISRKAIEKSKSYAEDNIMIQWMKLFESLIQQKSEK